MVYREGDGSVKLNKLGEGLAGAFAGGFSRFLVTPLDVLKIHFQLQIDPAAAGTAASRGGAGAPPAAGSGLPYYRSLTQASLSILRDGGLRGLWRGTIPATALWVSYMGVQFPAYRVSQTAVTDWLAGPAAGGAGAGGGAATATASSSTASSSSAAAAGSSSKAGGTAKPSSSSTNSLIASLVAGGASGAIATAVTYPLDWLRTRMAAQAYLPPHDRTPATLLVRTAWASEGLPGFFRGLTPSLVQVVPALAVTFATYEHSSGLYDALVQIVTGSQAWQALMMGNTGQAAEAEAQAGVRSVHDQLRSLFAGAAAGMAGKLAVYPLDTVKKRLQMQDGAVAAAGAGVGGGGATAAGTGAARAPPAPPPFTYRGTLHALASIARHEGVLRGWYKGTVPSLLKAGAAAALTFWSYEGAGAWLRTQSWAVQPKE